jgi:hypothetical protein
MLTLQMLPAARGDCLWLQYGSPARHVVIDGGLKDTAPALLRRMEQARRASRRNRLEIELLVVTHIDNDHIQGVIELLRKLPDWVHIGDIWFNGRPQLVELASTPVPEPRVEDSWLMGGDFGGSPSSAKRRTRASASFAEDGELLGGKEGDELSTLLQDRGLPWNRDPLWNGGAVVLPARGALPVIELEGGLRLTLLGPPRARLDRLRKVWSKVRTGEDEADDGTTSSQLLGRRDTWPPAWKEGEQADTSAANGSSIALLAEVHGDSLLLAGDAHARDLSDGVGRLLEQRRASASLPLSAFKLSHHASHRNLTRELLEKIDCERYLVSTDGSGHGHPDHQALLRVLRYSRRRPDLRFNYLRDHTCLWRDAKRDVLAQDFQDYDARFPEDADSGCILNLG